MRYQSAAAFRQALEQQLKDRADGDGACLARDRKRVAFDRLLARLLAVAPRRWLLKGGFALDLRLARRARADAPEDPLGGSHRFRVSASLAGRPFETFLLDVGFRHDDAMATKTLRTENLLGFAEIDPVEVDAAPLEIQVAEKIHAYTRTYEGGRESTRTKDLIDLVLIAELSRLDAAALRQEIDTIFALRETHSVPRALPPPPAEWAAPFRRLAEEVGAPTELQVGHSQAAALLDPVLSGEVTEGTWGSAQSGWAATDS